MEKKKILLIYYKLFRAGGVAKVMTNLANELAEQNYEVEILLLNREQPHFYPLNDKITVHNIDTFSHWAWAICEFNAKYLKFIPKIRNINAYIYHIGVYLMLKNWLNKNHHQYSTIISCWYKLSCFLGMNKKVARKTIAWEHTDYNVGGWLFKDKLRKFYKNLNNIICINSPSKTYYEQFNTTYFIPNIIGEPFESKEYIPAEKKKNLISFVGRLDKDKNVKELIEIISETQLPVNWKLQIIGDGWEKQNLENLIREKKLQSKVVFLGSKTTEEIEKLLEKSKILVSTSLREGLPTVLLEAMFCSNVLIAYDCKYGPSDIINQENGFLIPLHNKESFKEKLEYLTQNKGPYYELNYLSYQESQKWKKDKILKQWKKIIN
ncbi:glycosyltransferase [Bergeyella zoohelcum]|uniref:GalNAc alpha-1,4-transferase n=1 Tax=Bergeyella zoohelcum TaxID=1015 RepID=A0A7Z8YQ31_9FLAO|nr:glycosyltransferase [Bergeyella zoohelcum]VDH04599.1 GalNAc alpha-1,4-transferase [Bergeyella zoohelcum]